MKDQKLRSKRKDVAMKQTLHFKAEFTISEGKIKEYKKLIKEMSNVVKANEPDTINYQFYFDRSEIRCIVHETYKNSEAVFSHINGVASKTILPRSMIYLESQDLRFSGPEAKSYKKQWKDWIYTFTFYLQDSVIRHIVWHRSSLENLVREKTITTHQSSIMKDSTSIIEIMLNYPWLI